MDLQKEVAHSDKVDSDTSEDNCSIIANEELEETTPLENVKTSIRKDEDIEAIKNPIESSNEPELEPIAPLQQLIAQNESEYEKHSIESTPTASGLKESKNETETSPSNQDNFIPDVITGVTAEVVEPSNSTMPTEVVQPDSELSEVHIIVKIDVKNEKHATELNFIKSNNNNDADVKLESTGEHVENVIRKQSTELNSSNPNSNNDSIITMEIDAMNNNANNSTKVQIIEADSNADDKEIIQEQKESLIKVTNGCKSYGKHIVLDNLNIDVKQGSIYALLGASGCGKTTLLSCIVGIKALNSGSISFDGEDLEIIKSRGGLRHRVGYMPQELALYKEFTIKEALLYFGRIYRMSKKLILSQGRFLVEFLHLPNWNTQIRQMSGGQQRRTSFAVALIHSPTLLILDEPTVGVDPLLRQSIWEHLTKLVSTTKTTVIITTHYIDEAKNANIVGLMRNGHILAEGSPNTLLDQYGSSNLEDLFLILSQLDESDVQAKNSSNNNDKKEKIASRDENDGELNVKTINASKKSYCRIFPYPGYFSRLHALIMKNFVYIWRQLLFIFFLILFPAIQIFLCCWAIGTEPWDLPFGIVNYETLVSNKSNTTCSQLLVTPCSDVMLSCAYIQKLSNTSTFHLIHYESEAEALIDMRNKGSIYGYVVLSSNFTKTVLGKIGAAPIQVQLDMTSRHISITIQRALGEVYQDMFKERLSGCTSSLNGSNVTTSATSISTFSANGPIDYQKPIYGHSDQTIVIEYVGPGLVLGVIFFAAISITGLNYVVEKKEGMLERTIVAGVSTSEVITAQLLSQCAIVIIQTIVCLIVLFGVFKIPIHGPLVGVIVISVLQGFLGMFAGFVLSSICDEEKVVMQWSLAITLPMIVVAGIFWPTAGMPVILQWIAFIFVPQTYAAESIRSMLSRGWSLQHPKVWPGFAITIGYSLGLWILANLFAKRSVSPKK